MKKTQDIKHEVVAEIKGYQVIRSEALDQDWMTGKLSGHKKVFYDVVDAEDMYDSFKTLREAKAFIQKYL